MEHKIKTITLYRGVTRLARSFGVSQSHLSRVIRGERKPGKTLARRLARMGVAVGGAEIAHEHGTGFGARTDTDGHGQARTEAAV